MTTEQKPSYEELERRLASATAALQALRPDQANNSSSGNIETLVAGLAEAEAREAHINQMLRAIRNVNQLIVHEIDPKRLIDRACATLTETLGYYNA
jgi:hypothetical protein